MKRIIFSIGSIAFVAALAMGATGAFFSDSETSTGNTFTAGTLDLQVDSTSRYAGLVCHQVGDSVVFHWIDDPADATPTTRPDLIDTPCDGTWVQKSLGPENKFFNISDIKPGDSGEDTISLHVSNNAWICANITTTSNLENTHLAAETAAGDTTDDPNGGELAQNTFVFGWIDNASTSGAVAGDNKWRAGETVLFQPTALSAIQGGGLNLPLADSQHGTALAASTTNYIGVAWCTGTIDVSVLGTIKCDGSTIGNIIQTDSATADITLTATQSRNNPTFLCNPSPEHSPKITNISPTSGATVGGDRIHFDGTGFQCSNEHVYFGGRPSGEWSDSQFISIDATTPAGNAGPADITITNDCGTVTVHNGFTYIYVPPAISSISPPSGSTAGGDNITIHGVGFAVGVTVSIGGVNAINVFQQNETTIGATTPAGAAGPADVVVKNPDGGIATSTGAFIYSP